jgi:hypothetical protein
MTEFLMADLNAKGELQFQQPYSYALLEQVPGAMDLIAQFSGAMWRDPQHFELSLSAPCKLNMRWTAVAETAGIATLRQDEDLVSLTILACGIDPPSDATTLEVFQSHLLRHLHDTGIEPAFALLQLPHRPLAATINFRSPPQQADQKIVALSDRCFAAAYFRYHQLL